MKVKMAKGRKRARVDKEIMQMPVTQTIVTDTDSSDG